MRVWHTYKSRKYLTRILLSVTVIMVAVLFLASLALQFNGERSALRIQQDANRKVMNQIQFNIAYMTEVLNNLALSLYMDPNIMPLFTLRDRDEVAVIRSMNTLNQAYMSSSFLHSILVYNGFEDQSYAVGELGASKPGAPMADGLVQLLKKTEKLPRMKLLPMSFGGKEGAVDFFSIVLYQNFDAVNSRNESAIVVNIKPEWLYENLQAVNGFAQPDQSGLFLLDKNGTIIQSENDPLLPDRQALKAALGRHSSSAEPFGSFTSALGGSKKLFVTYLNMREPDWQVVSVQPYDAVLGGVREMRDTSVLVIAALLLLAVGLSVLLAHKLYKPIERLVRQIGIDPGQSRDEASRDELSAVANVYSSLVQKLHGAEGEQDKQKRIVKNYFLRSLIAGSPTLTEAEFAEQVERQNLRIAPQGPYRLVLVHMDGRADGSRSATSGERALYAFAIGNIAEELMRRSRYRCEIADMRSDHLVMLVSREGGEREDAEALTALLRQIQDVVAGYYKLSVTMTLSRGCDSGALLSERYGEAVHFSRYKLLLGRGAIITPERVRANVEQTEYAFPEEAEKKLIESIRVNDLEGMESAAGDILGRLSACHYDHIVHGILHVVDIVKATVREMNRNRVVSLGVDLSALSRQVLEQETMEEVAALFRDVFRDIHERLNRLDHEKNSALVDAIKEIIELNYKDRNLSLQGIAAMLHMTPAYVGRMFKTSEHVSVAEYVNEVRLKHARGYLETKGFSIKEIMDLVGYVNESTFFKLFKKSFGVTPKEYRLKKALS